jgi:hypothetical protein
MTPTKARKNPTASLRGFDMEDVSERRGEGMPIRPMFYSGIGR